VPSARAVPHLNKEPRAVMVNRTGPATPRATGGPFGPGAATGMTPASVIRSATATGIWRLLPSVALIRGRSKKMKKDTADETAYLAYIAAMARRATRSKVATTHFWDWAASSMLRARRCSARFIRSKVSASRASASSLAAVAFATQAARAGSGAIFGLRSMRPAK
jgi:hypothetical protein